MMDDAEHAAAIVSAAVAKLIDSRFKTDTYSSLNADSEDIMACSICLHDFQPECRVTALRCDARHIKHKISGEKKIHIVKLLVLLDT